MRHATIILIMAAIISTGVVGVGSAQAGSEQQECEQLMKGTEDKILSSCFSIEKACEEVQAMTAPFAILM